MRCTRCFIALFLIFLVALLLRSFPVFINSLTGPDPWFHARMAEMVVSSHGVPRFDGLSMQGRHYSYAPLFHVLLASFSIASSFDVLLVLQLLPVLWGSLCVFLAFAFAKRFFKSNAFALFAALVIALMPLHLMRTAAYARPDSLALLLVPAIIFLVYLNRFVPAAFLSSALVLLHPLSFLYLSLFLLVWLAVARLKSVPFQFKGTLALVLLGLMLWLIWLYSLPYPLTDYVSMVSFESAENVKPTLLNFFTFFTFSWVFLLVGFARLNAKNHLFLLSWILLSLLYASFSARLAIFLSMPVAVTAANGFGFVFEKTKRFLPVFFFLVFALALAVVVNEAYSTNWFVSPAEREAMLWLRGTPSNAVIASQWDRGHPLAYLSKRKVFIDGYFEFAPELDARNNSMKTLIFSSDCNKLFAEKERWGINYFFVHHQAFGSLGFKHGLLEANCGFISWLYLSDFALVLGFD